MFLEEIEKNDWGVTPDDPNNIRKLKSIEAYWLHNWYDKMKNITFNTYIYSSENEIPDVLPFNKCMVRYENKSPKDSEFWGPISTKQELLNVFYTSLRCKTNPGKYYCVREWTELEDNEYRCFWNNGLVAISSELEHEPPIDIILDYVDKIKDKIFYNRCVFDIAHLKNTKNEHNKNFGDLIFVEFNSWESNSGAHRFNWSNDTESFYDTDKITVRWLNGEKKISHPICKIKENDTNNNDIIDMSLYDVITPNKPCNYLVTDRFIYLTNDIWLGRFDLNLKPINWKRGMFRFTELYLCEDGCIFDGDNFYYYDLTPKKTKSKICNYDKNKIYENKNLFKYGITLKNKQSKEVHYVRILSDTTLYINK